MGLIAALFAFSLVFGLLEFLFPAISRQRRGFGEWCSDVLWWFFTPLVTRFITRWSVILAAVILGLSLGIDLQTLKDKTYQGYGPLSRQPLWLQGIEILILGDFLAYWVHRAFHRGFLWRFHAIHHSSENLDWLASVRLHPIDDIASRLVRLVFLLVAGFYPFLLAAYAPLLSLRGLFLHTNVSWDFGPLRGWLSSPRFHRWHHTKEPEGRDKNFSGLFPIWDRIFGTYYMPEDRQPQEFGVSESLPEHLPGQLLAPFQRRFWEKPESLSQH